MVRRTVFPHATKTLSLRLGKAECPNHGILWRSCIKLIVGYIATDAKIRHMSYSRGSSRLLRMA
jgi:hypothetical protein